VAGEGHTDLFNGRRGEAKNRTGFGAGRNLSGGNRTVFGRRKLPERTGTDFAGE
jgi:hypothetical protein